MNPWFAAALIAAIMFAVGWMLAFVLMLLDNHPFDAARDASIAAAVATAAAGVVLVAVIFVIKILESAAIR